MIDFQTATNAESLKLLLAHASRASITVTQQLALRTGGEEVTPAMRDELLAKVRAGEHVELELEVLAYEQRAGERNRNSVRHRDGSMMPLGKSGVGNPVMRDHEQDNSLAVAGRVIDSKTEKRGEGDYVVRQTWRLTAPWAVELALRGLLSTVSVSWLATGPVLCSVCNVPVFSQCYHCPGDRLSERVGDDGVKRLVRDRAGDTVVQWIYTSAELVETSVVPVPAVTSARIEGIRAALAAHDSGIAPPGEQHDMDPKLLALLGLAATAGVTEILSAVETLTADAAELKIVRSELAIANADLAELKKEKRQNEADTFIRDALSSGRIAKGDESHWRALFELSIDRARKLMAERPEGSATPVGQPRQSATNVTGEQGGTPTGGADGDPIAATKQILKSNGVDPDQAAKYARAMGVTGDPLKAIAEHCAGQAVG